MKLMELAVRTFCDIRADTKADAVYLYSQTRDNQESVLSAAIRLIIDKRAEKILIVNSEPKSGYPGYFQWKKELLQKGVPVETVSGVDLWENESLNTLIEAEGMIRYARENEYSRIYVVASPFHQLRAFMTSITAAMRYYPTIKIFSYNGRPLPWQDTVAHSQGETTGPRKSLIPGEIDRIRKYQEKGDLATESEILEYLDKRDR